MMSLRALKLTEELMKEPRLSMLNSVFFISLSFNF